MARGVAVARHPHVQGMAHADNGPAVGQVQPLVLIACSGSKRGGTNSCAAEKLYTGSLFVAALAAARSLTSDGLICIVSARHGFVTPRSLMRPYEQRWGERGAIAAERMSAQARFLPEHDSVVSLMPAEYVRRAMVALAGDPAPFLNVMAGVRGIGEMRQRLARITRGESPAPHFVGILPAGKS